MIYYPLSGSFFVEGVFMSTFLKKHWPDIIYFLLVAIVIGFSFVPMFNVVTKDADKNKYYFAMTIINFIFGSKINDTAFGPNIILIIVYILFVIGLVLFVVQLFMKQINEKVATILASITCGINVLFLFSLLFIYAYAPFINANLSNVSGFKEIQPISWSYAIFMFANIIMVLMLLRITAFQVKFSIYEISEIAIFCALALVLDKAKIPVGPTGGSINASALPLFIIAIRYGPVKGLFASSVVFGLISCLLDGYGIQTYPFDYLIAFSGYASVGLFMNIFKKHVLTKKENMEFPCICFSFILGGVVSFITRMLGSSISSVLFYELSFGEALIYNIAYIPLSVFGCMIIALVLAKPIQIVNNKFPPKTSVKTSAK